MVLRSHLRLVHSSPGPIGGGTATPASAPSARSPAADTEGLSPVSQWSQTASGTGFGSSLFDPDKQIGGLVELPPAGAEDGDIDFPDLPWFNREPLPEDLKLCVKLMDHPDPLVRHEIASVVRVLEPEVIGTQYERYVRIIQSKVLADEDSTIRDSFPA